MQSQAACAVMQPQFNLIYLSKLLSLYGEELWERKLQFHRLLCLECFYGLLHTKTSIGIYKQMSNDHSPSLEGKSPIFTADVQQSERGFYGFTYLAVWVYFAFLTSPRI